MARTKLNPVMAQVRGRIGDLVFKHYPGRLVVSQRPRREGLRPTPGQRAHRERFRAAVRAARTLLADPVQGAAFVEAARARGVAPLALAVADYFRRTAPAPVANAARAEPGIAVTVRNAAGAVLASGPATRRAGRWHYELPAGRPPGQPASVEIGPV
jgi:hypothetical protein